MRMPPCVCVSLILILPCGSLPAATYCVAQYHPEATDGGPGTPERPWKTIARAAEKAAAGDTILIGDGTYHEAVTIKTSGTADAPIRFEPSPGAHVVLTGADPVTNWQKVEGSRLLYSVAWPHRFITWSSHMTHPDDNYHRLIGRCEQVIIENYLLRQVLEADQLAPGTFFVDVTNQILQAWDAGNRDLNKVPVWASVRQEILRVEGVFVQVRGLRFRFAANIAQHGAVVLAGAHDMLEDCLFEDMNSIGATFAGEQQIVRRCVFRDNGQMGFGANGAHQLLFTECLVENNNTKGFARGWEAGGNKLVLCRDAVLERSRFLRNRGHGIWFDIGNEHCTVRQCLITDNEDSGIFYEISYGLQAHDNVITGNGFEAGPRAWGAWAGISISSSPDCVIERNLLVGNREGLDFREQSRKTPRIGKKQEPEVPIWNHDELIRRNIIALNRDAQVWGWFDVKDQRHWPAATQADAGPASLESSSPASAGEPHPPKSLEQLQLKFQDNVYFAAPGQVWFGWGVTWGRHKTFPGLADFQAGLGIDTGSRAAHPGFANPLAHDYRLTRQTMQQLQPNYPQGSVPGVLLGETGSSVQTGTGGNAGN
jgi:hypothetical protein